MNTVFRQSVPGRTGVLPAPPEKRAADILPKELLREKTPALPELSELDVVRHVTGLSRLNYSVDGMFHPLGSRTMKYNPKFMEYMTNLPGFTQLHPLHVQLPKGETVVQGALEALYLLEGLLCEITGMQAFSLAPVTGAQGAMTGALLIAAYHKAKGNKKTKILCPDTACDATAAAMAFAGYEVTPVASTNGMIDPAALATALDDSVAALVMSCPNALGLFEEHLPEIASRVHAVDALLYCDGTSLNAVLGRLRAGDAGFDAIHLNAQTLGAPHGGGDPAAGPVGVSERLVPFLPSPGIIKNENGSYALHFDNPQSIGKVSPLLGNFRVLLRALGYLLRLGGDGLARVSGHAVLNANYLRKRLENHLEIPHDRACMHAFAASAANLAPAVRALDLAKALLDKGYYAPAVEFLATADTALLFEPTETESKETLDRFCDDLIAVIQEAEINPGAVTACPLMLPVRRFDVTGPAENMVLQDEL